MREEGRRFTVADGMIVVAAVAILGAWLRADYLRVGGFHYEDVKWPEFVRVELDFWPPHVLATSTLTWLVLRLRRPCPSFRRIRRTPGWTACATAGLLVVPTLLIVAAVFMVGPSRHDFAYWHPDITIPISAVVAGAWMSLLWRGAWKAEPHWLDRSGRLIGFGWVALLVLYIVLAVWSRIDNGSFFFDAGPP